MDEKATDSPGHQRIAQQAREVPRAITFNPINGRVVAAKPLWPRLLSMQRVWVEIGLVILVALDLSPRCGAAERMRKACPDLPEPTM